MIPYGDNEYIKLFRKMVNWEWYTDVNTKVLFLHCLLRANWKDGSWKGIAYKRGQFITSLNTLAVETGLTFSQVRTALHNLIKTGEIASLSQGKNRIITVISYDSYQVVDKIIATSSQDDDKIIARSSQQYKNNKEDKEDKNNKKSSHFVPPSLEEVKAYCSERKNGIDPENFITFYQSKGWMIGKNKMKDWKAAIRTWEQRRKGEPEDEIDRKQRESWDDDTAHFFT
ncbi:MAG: hypothetical protein IKT59_10145 [Bacteroidales bacterium]|nr:hypothetical protein [Bacteroidales bacterium]